MSACRVSYATVEASLLFSAVSYTFVTYSPARGEGGGGDVHDGWGFLGLCVEDPTNAAGTRCARDPEVPVGCPHRRRSDCFNPSFLTFRLQQGARTWTPLTAFLHSPGGLKKWRICVSPASPSCVVNVFSTSCRRSTKEEKWTFSLCGFAERSTTLMFQGGSPASPTQVGPSLTCRWPYPPVTFHSVRLRPSCVRGEAPVMENTKAGKALKWLCWDETTV